MISDNEGSGDHAGVLQIVSTKFERNWERGKGLTKVKGLNNKENILEGAISLMRDHWCVKSGRLCDMTK